MGSKSSVVIIGGGTAGITVASRLSRLKGPPVITIVEPSEYHYYQPLWSMVGAGIFPATASRRDEARYIPKGARWIRDVAAGVDPDARTVHTLRGETLPYDFVVVAPGLQMNWEAIPGLAETIGRNGVCSNYGYEHAQYTWDVVRSFAGGTALFTQPATPIKCGAAPQKVMYLSADHFRKEGILDQTDIHFFTPGSVLFGIPAFRETLEKVVERYGINVHLRHELVSINGESKEAVIRVRDEDSNVVGADTYPFDMIHVAPPMSPPDFIRQSGLSNDAGWVDVDKNTLQHRRYPNVFALGDASSAPNAKTGAAIRKQAPVVVHNLDEMMRHGVLENAKSYDGYSSCPIITGYGKLVLAEFDFENRLMPSFPFDTSKERFSMYALKKYALPVMYWNGMLKGLA